MLEDKNGLPVTSATLCRIETVKPCTKDDFVVVAQGRLSEAEGTDGRIVT